MASDGWDVSEAISAPVAPPRAPASDDGWDVSDAIGGPAPPPTSAYEAAGGRSTWGDVWQGIKAGGHDVAASAAGALSAVQEPGAPHTATQSFALSQDQAAREAEQGMTPAGQAPGFFKHPLVSTAEAAPGIAAIAGPAMAAGPFAPVVVSGLLGAQQLGAAQNRAAGQGFELTPGQKLTQFGIGVVSGAIPELGLPAKIATSPIVKGVLEGGIGAGSFGAAGAGGEAVSQQTEIGAGKRQGYDIPAIVGAGETQAVQGAGVGAGAIFHGKTRLPEGGASAEPTRSSREGFKPEARGNTGKGPSVDAGDGTKTPGATGPAAPSSPTDDPAVGTALTGKPVDVDKAPSAPTAPVTPESKQPPVAQPTPVVAEQPSVAQPEPPPSPRPVEAPRTPDTTEPLPTPQPPPESQPPSNVAPAIEAREPNDIERGQHAELIDKTNPREWMTYPPGVQPVDISSIRSRYGQGELSDGSTIQYDRSGPSRLTKAKVEFADKNGRLDELLQRQPVEQVAAGEPGAVGGGAPPEKAAPTPTAPVREVPVSEARAEPASAQAEVVAHQPEVVVTPESKPDPLAGMEKLAANARGFELYRGSEGDYTVRKPDGTTLVAPEGQARAMFPNAFGKKILPAIQSEAERTAIGEAARQQAETVERQLKEVAAKKAREAAGEPAPKGEKHWTKKELAKQASDRAGAEKIVAAHPQVGPYARDLNAVYQRAKAMVADAKKMGVSIPDEFGEGHPHSPALLKLSEAKALIASGKNPPPDAYARFIDREHMIDSGRGDEALAARRAEGAVMLGSPEGKGEVAGKIDELEKPDDIKEAPAEHELVHERPEEHAAEAHEEAHGEEEGPTEAEKKAAEREALERKMAERRAESEAMRREAPAEPRATLAAFKTTTLKSRARKQSIADYVREQFDKLGEGRKGAVMAFDDKGNPVEVTPTRSTTIGDVIKERFDPKRYSPELRPMMERLRDAVVKIAGDTATHFISHDDMMKAGGAARGYYDLDADHIMLNNEYLRHDTPLHEAFHAAVTKALAADKQLKALMGRLWVDTAAKLPEMSPAEFKAVEYAFSDPEEFLTHLMTDDKVQNLLKGVKIGADLAKDIGIPKWRKATMWEGALGIIRRALGLGPRDVSAVEAAMAISEHAMWRRDPGMAMEAAGRLASKQMAERTLPKFQRIGPDDLGKVADDPEESGGKLDRSVKGMTTKLGSAAKTLATDSKPSVQKLGDRLMSEPQLYDTHRDLFKRGDSDPMRERLDAIQQRAGRADELSEPGHELAVKLRKLAAKHGNDVMEAMGDVKKTMNEFKVWAHEALGEGKNSHLSIRKGARDFEGDMDRMQARAVHAQLAKDFKALPEDVQAHILEEAKFYTDRYNLLATQKARDYIENIEPPEGSTKEDVAQRMVGGTLTDADREHYETKGIKNLDADDFQKRKGPYFPAERYGDFVVQAEHDVPTPKGSDKDFFGNALDPHIRRFEDRKAMHEYVSRLATKEGLPARVSTRYYMEDAQGGRIYKVPGTDRKITADEAATHGYSSPKPEYHVNVQNKHVSFHKTMSAAEDARRALQEDGLKNISAVQDRRGRGVDKSFTSAHTRALLANVDRRTDLTDAQKSLMKETILETAVVSQTGNRIAKNFARSQRVQGATYRGDALTQYSQASSRHLAAAEYAPKIDRAFERMREIMKDRDDDKFGYARSRVFNELQARSYNTRMENLYPQFSPGMQRFMNLAFVQDMASASHLLTHQLNLHFMGASVIGARHGVAATMMKFNKIMREAGGPWMATKHGFGAAWTHAFTDPEANGVSMFQMMRNGVKEQHRLDAVDALVASQHIHKESGLDLPPIGDSRSALQKVSRFIRDASGSMDSMGRFVTGLAAYDMEYAKQSSLPLKERHEAALQYARESIEKGLIHYGAGMRAPAFSSPMMRMVSQFRLPGTNMLYLLARNAYLAFRSADKTTRNEAYRTLGAMMIGGWALSGTSALPLEPLKLLGILGSQLGITPTPSAMSDELRRGLANEFGPTVADVILDGPLSLLGPYAPSFAHRVASPELTFGEPDSSKPDDLMKWMGSMSFGAVGGFGVNVLRGTQAVSKGDYPNAIKYLAPKQLADMARAYGLYSEGKADLPMAAAQVFGIRSQQVVRQQEGQHALYERLQADKEAEKEKPKTRGELLKQMHQQKVLGQRVTRKNKATIAEYERAYQ